MSMDRWVKNKNLVDDVDLVDSQWLLSRGYPVDGDSVFQSAMGLDVIVQQIPE